jgi:2-furoyl-CoA dehydrogenase large subunit
MFVGQPTQRVEDDALLAGQQRFLDDLSLPGLAHVAFVRSPYAHARIKGIDPSAALSRSHVYEVLTGDEIAQQTKPQRGRVPLANSPQVYALAYQKVRYVGEPVVAIAAATRSAAEDAADAVEVDYEPLPAIVDPDQAMKPGAPLVFDEIGSNVLWHDTFPYGDVEGAFATADQVVSERFTIHRYASTPLETFGSMVEYDPGTGGFTVWGHTQQPGQDLNTLAAALSISPGRIRLIIPPLGGGFGNKVRPLYHLILAVLARKAGRPVKWVEDRKETLLGLGHAADGIMEVEAAVKRDGEILGLRFRNVEDEGAGIDFAGRHNLLMLSNIVNCYRLQAVSYEGYSVVTNRCPVVANRGIGKPFMCFAVERMVDVVAAELGLDPVDIRMRNFIQPDQFPYDTPSGQTYDSGDYPEMLRRALRLVGLDEEAWGSRGTASPPGKDLISSLGLNTSKQENKAIGIGIATGVEPGGSNLSYGMLISGPNQPLSGQGEAARLRMESDGTVTVYTGNPDSGQGHATALAQIVADELGIEPGQVRVSSGFDSASHPYLMTSGNYSNKFHANDTAAAIGAARKVREKLLRRAAQRLEASVQDLELQAGRIFVRGSEERSLPIAAIANRAYWSVTDEQPDGEPGLEAVYYFKNPLGNRPDDQNRVRVQLGFSAAAHVAVVEVDLETFEVEVLRYAVVHDCGKEINPLIVDGQVHGATIHGIAAALLEEFVYDDDGQLLTTSFMDYLKPAFTESPDVRTGRLETPSPFTPLGTKGIGEGGAITAPAAIASAVEDALRPYGVRVTGLPITPARLWQVVHTDGKRYPS